MAAIVEAQSFSSSKRPREEVVDETQMLVEDSKRQKSSYNHILSLLDEEEEDPSQDLNSLMTTLQQELSSESLANPDHQENLPTDSSSSSDLDGYNSSSAGSSSPTSSSNGFSKENAEDESLESVMRHLLEASDDELGIPNRDEFGGGFEEAEGDLDVFNGGLSLCDGLWELEDEAANYYTLVQSELFM